MPKLRCYFLAGIAILMLIGLTACGTPQPAVVVNQVPMDLTKGSANVAIITFDQMPGLPTDYNNPQIISSAIREWEDSHPDRRIVSFQIIYQPYGNIPSRVSGIFIYSEPR